MNVIMTALAPLESRHPRLGQSLWWLWVMRPRCLHAHAAPAGVLVCPAGRPGEVSLPSIALSPHAGGGTGSGRRTPLGYAPPSPAFASLAFWGLGFVPPPPDLESSGWPCAPPGGAVGWGHALQPCTVCLCVCVCVFCDAQSCSKPIKRLLSYTTSPHVCVCARARVQACIRLQCVCLKIGSMAACSPESHAEPERDFLVC